jgi:hypothetical protein
MEAMASNTAVRCFPARGVKSGHFSIILLVDRAVLTTPEKRSAWLSLGCMAAGAQIRRAPNVKVDEIWVSDVARIQQHTAIVLPGPQCVSGTPP